jgi:hypothetical protein
VDVGAGELALPDVVTGTGIAGEFWPWAKATAQRRRRRFPCCRSAPGPTAGEHPSLG